MPNGLREWTRSLSFSFLALSFFQLAIAIVIPRSAAIAVFNMMFLLAVAWFVHFVIERPALQKAT